VHDCPCPLSCVKFKDEYKRRNVELSEENGRLKEENCRLFSATIEQRDQTITRLEQSEGESKIQISSLEKQLRLVTALDTMNKITTSWFLWYSAKMNTDTETGTRGQCMFMY
jgi:hypothetical protein